MDRKNKTKISLAKDSSLAWKQRKYLQICRIFDYINKEGNFCNIRPINSNNNSNIVTCEGRFKDTIELCCKGCKYLGDNGCTVNSIYCKISYCFLNEGPKQCGLCKSGKQNIVNQRYEKVLKIVNEYVVKHDIPCYNMRGSMADQFELRKIRKLINS